MSRICAGMRRGGGPMKVGSSSTLDARKGKHLPLAECPRCGVRLVKIKSKQPKTYDEVFYKCPNNIKEDPTTCRFIRSEQQYEAHLRKFDGRQECLEQQLCNLEALNEADCFVEMKHQVVEMKHQLGDMKQQVDRALGEVWTMKMQICELKQQMCEGKKAFDMRFPFVAILCVGVVIGMFAMMWKN